MATKRIFSRPEASFFAIFKASLARGQESFQRWLYSSSEPVIPYKPLAHFGFLSRDKDYAIANR
jgi:hypothetical protein